MRRLIPLVCLTLVVLGAAGCARQSRPAASAVKASSPLASSTESDTPAPAGTRIPILGMSYTVPAGWHALVRTRAPGSDGRDGMLFDGCAVSIELAPLGEDNSSVTVAAFRTGKSSLGGGTRLGPQFFSLTPPAALSGLSPKGHAVLLGTPKARVGYVSRPAGDLEVIVRSGSATPTPDELDARLAVALTGFAR